MSTSTSLARSAKAKIPDIRLRQLITHFSRYRLRNEDFEFPDLLGAAYEFLISDFADSAGKKGGEFYTPRSVVKLMVRLVKPKQEQHIYDPCCGSGGMLIAAKEYMDEQGEDGRKANWLRDFALDHPEVDVILQAID